MHPPSAFLDPSAPRAIQSRTVEPVILTDPLETYMPPPHVSSDPVALAVPPLMVELRTVIEPLPT